MHTGTPKLRLAGSRLLGRRMFLVSSVALLLVASGCFGPSPTATPSGAATPLRFVESVRGGNIGTPEALDAPSFVTVSPDGNNVYVAESGTKDALSVFSRDATTGALTFVQVLKDGVDGVEGLNGARSVIVSSDSRHVYTAASADDAVTLFSRDAETGVLTFVEALMPDPSSFTPYTGPTSVALSPDGRHIYQTTGFGLLETAARDATTGAITFTDWLADGEGGVDEIEGAASVVVSPNGRHVYVAAHLDNAVSVFSRETATGLVSLVQTVKDGKGDADKLEGAISLVLSPDGAHVYVAAWQDDAITVFRRNGMNGVLVFVEDLRDGKGGVDGLDSAYSVAVSPDGRHVYAAGAGDDALVVFSRNPETGELMLLGAHKDGEIGVDGLGGAISVAVSPDARHVYAVGGDGNAVAVFSVGD